MTISKKKLLVKLLDGAGLMFVRAIGDSMTPTINNGDLIIAVKRKFYKEGDIVIFCGEMIPSDFWSNRRVSILIKRLHINNPNQSEGHLFKNFSKGGLVYLLGDNKNHSIDSRIFGPVDVRGILGKVIITIKAAPKKELTRPKGS